jgi:hypothetical protein
MRSALKFIAGAIVAGLLWFYGTPSYNSALAAVVTPILHLDSRLRGTVLEREQRHVHVRRLDSTEFPNATIPADELTYNVILLGGLIAFRRGNAKRTAIALAVFVVTHALALLAGVESTYATKIANWSDQHYGGGEQDFWTAAEYLYRLAGMFAIAFAVWALSLPPGSINLLPPEKPKAQA